MHSTKPSRWDVSPGLVHPGTQGFWKGLVFCMPFWEGGGAPLDVAGKQRFALSGMTWQPSSEGVGLRGTANGADAGMTAPARLKLQPPFTIAMYATRLTTPSHGTGQFIMSYNIPATDPYVAYGFYWSTNWDALALMANEGVYRQAACNTPAIGTPQLSVAVFDTAGDAHFYADGLYYNDPISVGTIEYTATSYLCVGEGWSSTRSPQIAMHLACIWNRALAPGEILQWSRDPYQFIRSSQRIWAAVPAAPASGSPWYQQLQQAG